MDTDILKYVNYQNGNSNISVPDIKTLYYTPSYIVCGYKFKRTEYGIKDFYSYVSYPLENSLEINEDTVNDIYRIVHIIEYKQRRLGYLQLKPISSINVDAYTKEAKQAFYYTGDNGIFITMGNGSEYHHMVSWGRFKNGKFALYCCGIDSGNKREPLVKSKFDITDISIDQLKAYTIYTCEEVYKIIFEDIQFAPILPKSARNDVAPSTRVNF